MRKHCLHSEPTLRTVHVSARHANPYHDLPHSDKHCSRTVHDYDAPVHAWSVSQNGRAVPMVLSRVFHAYMARTVHDKFTHVSNRFIMARPGHVVIANKSRKRQCGVYKWVHVHTSRFRKLPVNRYNDVDVVGVLLHRCQETTEPLRQYSKGIIYNTTSTRQPVAVYDFSVVL